MADQPGQEAKDTGQETIFNSGIGDDWGEAFEAEDFMAAPSEEASTEFFLPDEATEATMLAGPVAGAEAAEPVAAPPGRLAEFFQAAVVRFRTIPLLFRLAGCALPLIVLLLFLTWRGKAPEVQTPRPVDQPQTVAESQLPGAEAPGVHPPAPESKAELEGKSEAEATPSPEPQALPEVKASAPEVSSLASTPLGLKELRKKWRFPAIVIHAKTDKDHASAILSIDLTLILKLAPEVMPPFEKEAFIREILYQFYTNQPVDDLQRYALERGEMNRKLQAWILKQWPELHLDSIAIDRYQLL